MLDAFAILAVAVQMKGKKRNPLSVVIIASTVRIRNASTEPADHNLSSKAPCPAIVLNRMIRGTAGCGRTERFVQCVLLRLGAGTSGSVVRLEAAIVRNDVIAFGQEQSSECVCHPRRVSGPLDETRNKPIRRFAKHAETSVVLRTKTASC